jgi:hypothetical protein
MKRRGGSRNWKQAWGSGVTDARMLARKPRSLEMTVAQVRKLLGDIAALQKRAQRRVGVIFRGPAGGKRNLAEPLDASLPDDNAAFVISTVYEARPNAKRRSKSNVASASRKASRR